MGAKRTLLRLSGTESLFSDSPGFIRDEPGCDPDLRDPGFQPGSPEGACDRAYGCALFGVGPIFWWKPKAKPQVQPYTFGF